MAAVTASTKSESPKIEWAGVETGAKIFVGLKDRSAGSARAATGNPRRRTTWLSRIRHLEEPRFRIFLSLRNSFMSAPDSSSLSQGSPLSAQTGRIRAKACSGIPKTKDGSFVQQPAQARQLRAARSSRPFDSQALAAQKRNGFCRSALLPP